MPPRPIVTARDIAHNPAVLAACRGRAGVPSRRSTLDVEVAVICTSSGHACRLLNGVLRLDDGGRVLDLCSRVMPRRRANDGDMASSPASLEHEAAQRERT
jgi:hypothetical protein